MNCRPLEKYGGAALIAGSALNSAYLLSFIVMADNHKILAALISLTGGTLMLIGSYVTYSRIRAKSGKLGAIGFLFIATSFIFQTGNTIFESFLVHRIVADSPISYLLMYDRLIQQTPLVFLLRNTILVTSIAGGLLFNLALHRSHYYPQLAPPLIVAGTIGGFVWPVYPMVFSITSIIIYTVGYFLIGFHLSKQSKQSAT